MTTDAPHESILRDPLDSFTDRKRILAQFTQLLGSVQAGDFRLLAIKGNSGTGKTFLIEYLSKRVCPPAGWHTGTFVFAESFPDFRTILDGLEDALKRCVPRESLKSYRIQREKYKQSFDEYRATITINQQIDAKEAASVSQSQMSASVNAELRRRELQLRAELTRALLELAEECEHPLCLFIDGYERLIETDPELTGWFLDEVLLNLSKNSPYPVLVVTCGWEYPTSAALQPFSTNDELDDFDVLRIKDYLQVQGIFPENTSTNEPLINAFYNLSKGHPLVLSLAVAYFQLLPLAERTPENLHAKSPLVTEDARVQWLEVRLLRNLPEPYRTLLERGPILRSFNQDTLRVLLNVAPDGNNKELTLDDRAYTRFLQYPFINRKNPQGDTLLEQPTFHMLMRNVRLDELRRLHPETKQLLHRTIADYYKERLEAEKQNAPKQVSSSDKDYARWFAEIPEQQFHAQIEFLYHALQVKEMQVEAFETWRDLTSQAVDRWRRKQAGPLLELVQQVVEEGEPFFDRQSDSYGQYLMWYSRFLQQESRWNEVLFILQEAVQVFEASKNTSDRGMCFNNMGMVYYTQGQLPTALEYYQRALALQDQMSNSAGTALVLNNIGMAYYTQGQLSVALEYYQRALTLQEQMRNTKKNAI